ncbi:MAG TPA: DUF2846 domain-containing protein [Caulobacteraceae bacterium]|nr:DUF2846 domain-containing protein [Caulobacteraceae bacterium]
MTIKLSRPLLSASLLLAALVAAPGAMAQGDTGSAQPASGAPPAAEAPAAPSGRVSTPPAGKGQVVFFRPFSLAGMALSFSIRDADKGVAKLGPGTYAVYVADPGQHTFTVQSEATDTLHVEVDAGETYYVKQTIGMGIMVGRPHLTPSDETTFDGLKSMKVSAGTPTDRKETSD